MILTKAQIIDLKTKENTTDLVIIKIIRNKNLSMPEIDFINWSKSELNFNLEIVRKNLYIIK